MPDFIITVGELRKKAKKYESITELMLLSAEDHAANTEIEVVTLQQAERDEANNLAWLDTSAHSLSDVEDKIEQILETAPHFQEFILVREDKIVIGVDRDTIDDSAVDRAMMMLIEMDSFIIDSYKVFGDQL